MKFTPTPHNTVVLEATALLSILKEFNSQPNALEKLYDVFDTVVIPDQVFYELTAILPSSHEKLKKDLIQAKAGGREALDNVIDAYVRASPRTGIYEIGAMAAAELKALLYFVAEHPDALQETSFGKHFCDGLKADHSMLDAGHDDQANPRIQDYRPSRGDIMSLLGNRFKPDALRVHIDEIYQIGLLTKMPLMDDREYKERKEKAEMPGARKRRFINLLDFLSLPGVKATIPARVLDELKSEYAPNDSFLKVGQLRRCVNAAAEARGDKNYNIEKMANIGHMNMGQYIHSGLLPDELTVEMADHIGFVVPSHKNSSKEVAEDHLKQLGFFEHTPTIGELRQLLTHYPQDSRFELLSELAYSERMKDLHAKQFDKECKNPIPMRAEVAEKTEHLKVPDIGVPFEKGFTEALVAGTVNFGEFFEIALKTKSMTVTDAADVYTTPRHDVMVKYDRNRPDNSVIYVKQKGFMARSGSTKLPYTGSDGIDHEVREGKFQKFWAYRVKDFIGLAQQSRGGLVDPPFHRVFDAMLYSAADLSASQLHHAALEQLGEARLVQLEKDFSNVHYRGWNKAERQPAFESTLATFHIRRRIAGKHVGDLATAECANRNVEEGNTVWIANHDNALKADPNGVVRLSEDMLRQRTEMKSQINSISEALVKNSDDAKVQILPTFQLLHTLAELVSMEPDFSRPDAQYGKTSNVRWQEFIHTKPSSATRSGV